MAALVRADAADYMSVCVLAYDRRQLRNIEFAFLVRRGVERGVGFFNEHGRYASPHGHFAAHSPSLGVWDLELNFSCLGGDAWLEYRSFTLLHGTHGWLEGSDSQQRTVRAAAVAMFHCRDEFQLVQLAAPIVGFVRAQRRYRMFVAQLPWGRQQMVRPRLLNLGFADHFAVEELPVEDDLDWVWL